VQKAEGCTLWPDPMQFAVAHLEAVLRSNLTDFVGVQEVSNLLERWGRMEKGRELIAAALPDTLTRQRFVRLLRALLRERVPITNWERILEAVGEAGLENDEIDHAVRHVRLRIKNDLPGNEPGAKLVSVPTEIESAVLRWVTTVDGRRFLAIPPEATQDLLAKVRALVSQDDPAVLLVTEREDVRAPLRRLIELEFPHVAVQWREETLDEEQRQSPLGRIPVIAEWSESGNQGVEAEHAG
jgi:flagellar biosynthesis component FlhA